MDVFKRGIAANDSTSDVCSDCDHEMELHDSDSGCLHILGIDTESIVLKVCPCRKLGAESATGQARTR